MKYSFSKNHKSGLFKSPFWHRKMIGDDVDGFIIHRVMYAMMMLCDSSYYICIMVSISVDVIVLGYICVLFIL